MGLCKKIADAHPKQFIWTSDQDLLFEKGAGDSIWVSGGALDQPPRSILGSMACSTPLSFS
ncbi:MAG: hypothetical protein HQM13_22410 [SAR324 cluster bacterium]|nr:hypothetical protein [SAR324 cluster bacterium]